MTAKRSIVYFVSDVTTAGGAGYVAPSERVAVFDNDGTCCDAVNSDQVPFTREDIARLHGVDS